MCHNQDLAQPIDKYRKKQRKKAYSQILISNYTVTKGEVWGEITNWEIAVDIYTLLYIKKVTNESLLDSTGNCTIFCNDLHGERI